MNVPCNGAAEMVTTATNGHRHPCHLLKHTDSPGVCQPGFHHEASSQALPEAPRGDVASDLVFVSEDSSRSAGHSELALCTET